MSISIYQMPTFRGLVCETKLSCHAGEGGGAHYHIIYTNALLVHIWNQMSVHKELTSRLPLSDPPTPLMLPKALNHTSTVCRRHWILLCLFTYETKCSITKTLRVGYLSWTHPHLLCCQGLEPYIDRQRHLILLCLFTYETRRSFLNGLQVGYLSIHTWCCQGLKPYMDCQRHLIVCFLTTKCSMPHCWNRLTKPLHIYTLVQEVVREGYGVL